MSTNDPSPRSELVALLERTLPAVRVAIAASALKGFEGRPEYWETLEQGIKNALIVGSRGPEPVAPDANLLTGALIAHLEMSAECSHDTQHRADGDAAVHELRLLEKRLHEAREALRPFAELATYWARADEGTMIETQRVSVEVRLLRRAKEVLGE